MGILTQNCFQEEFKWLEVKAELKGKWLLVLPTSKGWYCSSLFLTKLFAHHRKWHYVEIAWKSVYCKFKSEGTEVETITESEHKNPEKTITVLKHYNIYIYFTTVIIQTEIVI